MKAVSILALFLLLFTGCSERYQFWEISKFNIVDTALKDQEEIKLLYTSRGPDENTDKEYYIQIVAVSQKTGDTVNILTTIDSGFSEEDKDKVFNFIDKNNIASKIIEADPEKINNLNDVEKLDKAEAKKIIKVARDPEFDFIADNRYPTVIGNVGIFTKP